MADPGMLSIWFTSCKTNSEVICSPEQGYYRNFAAGQSKFKLKFTLMKQNQFYYV
jgi:hypothetical protein